MMAMLPGLRRLINGQQRIVLDRITQGERTCVKPEYDA